MAVTAIHAVAVALAESSTDKVCRAGRAVGQEAAHASLAPALDAATVLSAGLAGARKRPAQAPIAVVEEGAFVMKFTGPARNDGPRAAARGTDSAPGAADVGIACPPGGQPSLTNPGSDDDESRCVPRIEGATKIITAGGAEQTIGRVAEVAHLVPVVRLAGLGSWLAAALAPRRTFAVVVTGLAFGPANTAEAIDTAEGSEAIPFVMA